jgi:hypothetical protein
LLASRRKEAAYPTASDETSALADPEATTHCGRPSANMTERPLDHFPALGDLMAAAAPGLAYKTGLPNLIR